MSYEAICKAPDKNSVCFKNLVDKFPTLTEAKITEGVFVGPQIRELMKTTDFENTMTPVEKNAWISFRKVLRGFLGNDKATDYVELVSNMQTCVIIFFIIDIKNNCCCNFVLAF